MSIIVKGMKMPDNCGECPMICEDDLCRITKGGRTIKERPPHCPLADVPTPHGRLIDADALRESIKEARKHKPEIADDYFIVADWLRSAPTIIEREAGT